MLIHLWIAYGYFGALIAALIVKEIACPAMPKIFYRNILLTPKLV